MRILYWTLGIVLLDQLSKIFVKGFSIPFLNTEFSGMLYGDSIPLIGDFFKITFVENPGMAFGVDLGDDVKLWVSIFSVVASIGLFVYLYTVRKQGFSLRFSLAFILGGAIGNFIDRVFYGVFYGYAPLFYGKVVDFFDIDFFDFEILGRTYDRWPIFNVADMAVSIGVLALVLFYKKHEKKEEVVQGTEAVSEVGIYEQQSMTNEQADNGKENKD
ncbi:MAG TPA: signal peptidase II [Ignavibacteriaceae bacterium]|nr:signal peptidase II [Ignavibacteriaceae bacterium]